MTLRRRLTLLAAASVALAVCLAAVVTYVAVRAELRGQVDDELRASAERAPAVADRVIVRGSGSLPQELVAPPDGPPPAVGSGQVFFQRILPSGEPASGPAPTEFSAPIPITSSEQDVAASGDGQRLSDATVDGEHVRVMTVGIGQYGAFQIARSLEGVDDVLANLRTVLVLVMLGGIGLAALLARRLADRTIAPITELTEAAEHISETEDLSKRIGAAGDDEVGRLASRFDAMLATLEGSRQELADSVAAQRQLVADASHELRTPIASLRTDIEVLRDEPAIDPRERERMLDSIDARIEELGALVSDVIELARGDQLDGALADVRLDRLVEEAVARMRRHAPGREFELEVSESVVEGRADRLARAVNNLLDNAVKFSNGDRPIEVSVAGGEVAVRDHGPGIPAAELDRVFDRFHRGAEVRDVPGSGLGLAIVKQVAETHGGSVSAENAAGGGAVFRLRLPSG